MEKIFSSNSTPRKNGAIGSAGQGMKTKKGIIRQQHDRHEKNQTIYLTFMTCINSSEQNVMQHAKKEQICFAMAC